MDQKLTDAVAASIAAWVTKALSEELGSEQLETLQACLRADQTDVCVVVRLREGHHPLRESTAATAAHRPTCTARRDFQTLASPLAAAMVERHRLVSGVWRTDATDPNSGRFLVRK
jgi:hypothetical protein